jgi:hypothetical protein
VSLEKVLFLAVQRRKRTSLLLRPLRLKLLDAGVVVCQPLLPLLALCFLQLPGALART